MQRALPVVLLLLLLLGAGLLLPRVRGQSGQALPGPTPSEGARKGHPPLLMHPTPREPFAALLFTKTAGFRHDSIPAGIQAIQALGDAHSFRVTHSEEAARFTDEGLAPYQVVIFLNTTGDILDDAQQQAFERFIGRGGGFVGIHAASDTEYDWPWYGALVGRYFADHPAIQAASLTVVEASHPSTVALPTTWSRTDEWYNFRAPLAPDVTVLLTIDERSYSGGTMGAHHPIAWYHLYQGGRAWYTAMGHTVESYQEPLFLAHLAGGIRWAAGVSSGTHSAEGDPP